ncbi:MAG: PadR family transcriptional regulator, partial [Corynebacterium sp.]|nr:PadR family transcriptional regulator [Corynebacterium sp.]
TPVVQAVTERDELVTKVTLAQTRADLDLIKLLDTQRASIMDDLRALNRRTRNLPNTRTTDRLLIEKRIFELEAQARWLDRVESLQNPTPESDNGHE